MRFLSGIKIVRKTFASYVVGFGRPFLTNHSTFTGLARSLSSSELSSIGGMVNMFSFVEEALWSNFRDSFFYIFVHNSVHHFVKFSTKTGTWKISGGRKFSEIMGQKLRVLMIVIAWNLAGSLGKTCRVRKCKTILRIWEFGRSL